MSEIVSGLGSCSSGYHLFFSFIRSEPPHLQWASMLPVSLAGSIFSGQVCYRSVWQEASSVGKSVTGQSGRKHLQWASQLPVSLAGSILLGPVGCRSVWQEASSVGRSDAGHSDRKHPQTSAKRSGRCSRPITRSGRLLKDVDHLLLQVSPSPWSSPGSTMSWGQTEAADSQLLIC